MKIKFGLNFVCSDAIMVLEVLMVIEVMVFGIGYFLIGLWQ